MAMDRGNTNTQMVDVVRGDLFVEANELPIPKAVKIDVEGYEEYVLQGLSNTLSNPVCELICIEVHDNMYPSGRATTRAVFKSLRSLGFSRIEVYPGQASSMPFAIKSSINQANLGSTKKGKAELPEISVIIPTYNRAEFLSQSVSSVLNQTYTNFELIIIDDYSTDDTEKLVKNFNDKRIVYIKHRRNSGQSAARNTGIEASNGQHIAFLDSDDVYLPTKLYDNVIALREANDRVGGSCPDCGGKLNGVYSGAETIIRRA